MFSKFPTFTASRISLNQDFEKKAIAKEMNSGPGNELEILYSAKIQTLEPHGPHHFGEAQNVSGANHALLPTHFF